MREQYASAKICKRKPESAIGAEWRRSGPGSPVTFGDGHRTDFANRALAQHQPLANDGVAHSGIAGRISERPRYAARPGRAAPSGYPRRPGATRSRAAASRGAPRMTHADQDKRARSWPRPGDGRGQSRRPPGRPPQPTARPLDATSRRQQQRWGEGWPRTAETAMPSGTRAAPSATIAP